MKRKKQSWLTKLWPRRKPKPVKKRAPRKRVDTYTLRIPDSPPPTPPPERPLLRLGPDDHVIGNTEPVLTEIEALRMALFDLRDPDSQCWCPCGILKEGDHTEACLAAWRALGLPAPVKTT